MRKCKQNFTVNGDLTAVYLILFILPLEVDISKDFQFIQEIYIELILIKLK